MIIPSIFALLAAIFYALNSPVLKLLLENFNPTMLAGFLYLGAGIGIGIIFIINKRKSKNTIYLNKSDLPYVVGMVILDVIAPILLMYGLKNTTSASSSLLNNFEIVATTIIAFLVFKEFVSKRLIIALLLITSASIILTVNDFSNLEFSFGSLLVLLATICWGFENNFTKKISHKDTYQIVMIKGLGSGTTSLLISFIIKANLPAFSYILGALVLGFVAYGLSITFYIKAQSVLGASKTSMYYAFAPFISSLLSLLILDEPININYYFALSLMLLGTIFVIIDSSKKLHEHIHVHELTYFYQGKIHQTTIIHSHIHEHGRKENHLHSHKEIELKDVII